VPSGCKGRFECPKREAALAPEKSCLSAVLNADEVTRFGKKSGSVIGGQWEGTPGRLSVMVLSWAVTNNQDPTTVGAGLSDSLCYRSAFSLENGRVGQTDSGRALQGLNFAFDFLNFASGHPEVVIGLEVDPELRRSPEVT
jgi:hypothetical protein